VARHPVLIEVPFARAERKLINGTEPEIVRRIERRNGLLGTAIAKAS
jgi:hypothetical protein